ncbi:MAG: hypothetical protein GXY53_05255 [Desulfobulbus sp.]|nr:hypothetical protein [Desulfobulbus sp.]
MNRAQRKHDTDQHRELVDDILKKAAVQICEEISALLSGSLQITLGDGLHVATDEYIGKIHGKQIVARLSLTGNGEEQDALFLVPLKTAVYLGGALIMMPMTALDEMAGAETYDEDVEDAYSEIVEIISAGFSAVFAQHYPDRLEFAKTAVDLMPSPEINQVDEIFSCQTYYCIDGQLQYNDRDIGEFHFFLPARAVGLTADRSFGDRQGVAGQHFVQDPEHDTVPAAANETAPVLTPWSDTADKSADILLVTDDAQAAEHMAAVLIKMGFSCRLLSFKDPINSVLSEEVRLVFLVMREPSEQAFGAAIKISTAGLSIPMVAAAPLWTRSLVLKAVKYGACDILITPASAADIRETLSVNLVKKLSEPA